MPFRTCCFMDVGTAEVKLTSGRCSTVALVPTPLWVRPNTCLFQTSLNTSRAADGHPLSKRKSVQHWYASPAKHVNLVWNAGLADLRHVDCCTARLQTDEHHLHAHGQARVKGAARKPLVASRKISRCFTHSLTALPLTHFQRLSSNPLACQGGPVHVFHSLFGGR